MTWTLGRLVVVMTLVFLTKSCQRIPRIIHWQCIWKASSFHRSSSNSIQAFEPCRKIGSMQVWYKRSFVYSWRWVCCQTLFIEYMAEEAVLIRLNISGWHLPVVDRIEPRYVNSVTSSTECPLTDNLDMLESPASSFWILVSCQDYLYIEYI